MKKLQIKTPKTTWNSLGDFKKNKEFIMAAAAAGGEVRMMA
jgi:uncharacterized protein (DUF849 family)